MKRFRRWLFNLAAVVSLLLAIAAAVQRSIHYSDLAGVRFFSKKHLVVFSTFEGGLFIKVGDYRSAGDAPTADVAAQWLALPSKWHYLEPAARMRGGLTLPSSAHQWLGFGYGDGDGKPQPASSQMQSLMDTKQTAKERIQADSDVKAGRAFSATTRFTELDQIRVARATPLHSLQLPFWFLASVFSILPAVQVWRFFFRRQRRAQGLCIRCGYDLRATPDRCPECGTIPTAAKGAAT